MWLSDYAWLLAGCLFVLVAVRSSAEQAEDASMREHRQRIEEMPSTDRERLRHNQSEFESLSTPEERRCRELHEAVSQNQKLDQTLTAWHNWLATLSIDQREKILQTTDPSERIKMIRSYREQERSRRDWSGRRTFESQWGRGPGGPVRFSPQDYLAMLQVTARWCEIPIEAPGSDAKSVLADHVLIITEMLDRVFPGWDRLGTGDGPRGSRSRPEFPPELRQGLVSVISDPALQRMLKERPDFGQGGAGRGAGTSQNLMLMSFFIRGLFDEARRLVVHDQLSDDERLAVYLGLPEHKRAELDRLPREMFKFRIQWISMLKTLEPEAAGRFERLSRMFERIYRKPGSGQPGRRPDDPGRPGERQPGRAGDRRPGDGPGEPLFRGNPDRPPGDPPPRDGGE